jgi:adenosylcobinamide kinase/adenosylcobinamide-phosphate guanylyltransferase
VGEENGLRAAVLTGSAAGQGPVPGCRCLHCLPAASLPAASLPAASLPAASAPGAAWSAPSGLLVPGALRVDGAATGSPGDDALPRVTTRPDQDGDLPGTQVLRAGQRAELGGVRIVALPAGTAAGEPDPHRVVLVLGSGARTLLWAAGSGPLPDVTLDALDGARLAAAVVDAGDLPSRDGSGDGLAAAHQVARLRRAGALADEAVLIAAGRPHTGPAPQRLARQAAPWGVRVPPDGSPVWAGQPGEAGQPVRAGQPRRTVVLGAAGSGKSLAAESLLAALPEVVYVATGPRPDDPDGADPSWAARIAAHRRRRPPWWRTVESGDLADLLTTPGPALLVDSLGTWLTAELGTAGCWDDRPGWQDHLAGRTQALVEAWRQAARPVVLVAEEVGWGIVPATVAGSRFRDALGPLSRRLAEASERVLLVVAGRTVDLDRKEGEPA